jgi:hypothetical protein
MTSTPSVPEKVLLENRVCLTNTLPGRHSFWDGVVVHRLNCDKFCSEHVSRNDSNNIFRAALIKLST